MGAQGKSIIEAYSLTATEDGYSFKTSAGVEYILLFSEYQPGLFPDLPELRHNIFAFSFFPLSEPVTGTKYDARIMPTIVQAIKERLSNEVNVVLFIGDDNDGRHEACWRLFDSLSNAMSASDLEMINSVLSKGDKSVECAIILHRSNP